MLFIPGAARAESTSELFAPANKDPLHEPSFQALRKRFEEHVTVRAEFAQEKQLHALSRPLVARGFFLYAKDHGVVWHTREPFRALLRITPEGLYQRFEGEEPGRVAANKQELFTKLQNVFSALFEARIEALAQDFELFFKSSGDHWQLGLEPLSATGRLVAKRIVAEGVDHVDLLTIVESSNDSTTIRFENVRTAPKLLPDEQFYFDDEPQP